MNKERRAWSSWEDTAMTALYPDSSNEQLARLLGRTNSAIKNRANTLGIHKSEEFNKAVNRKTRFSKGQQAWNKGKPHPSSERSRETQFKKGEKPKNWVPIGAERITKEGYLQRKITDTGVTRNDFIPVHHLVWIEHTGRPVPDGYALIFKDGDRRNFAPENLELISRADLMRRNSIHRLPPEVTSQVRVLQGFNRKLRRIERERSDRPKP